MKRVISIIMTILMSLLTTACASAAEPAGVLSKYIDNNGDVAVIPAEFTVSETKDEQAINTGLVVTGLDGSEFVWIPATDTELSGKRVWQLFLWR